MTLIGIILCGGKSERMQKDKGLMLSDGQTWSQLASYKLQSLNIPTYVSINSQQLSEYITFFENNSIIIDNNEITVKGPLHGVLSCHLNFPNNDLFVLAPDMPLINAEILKNLISIYHANKTKEAFVYTHNESAEPLCAIYTAKGLSKILEQSYTNELTKFSMKHMIEELDTLFTSLQEEQYSHFKNINTKDDLTGL